MQYCKYWWSFWMFLGFSTIGNHQFIQNWNDLHLSVLPESINILSKQLKTDSYILGLFSSSNNIYCNEIYLENCLRHNKIRVLSKSLNIPHQNFIQDIDCNNLWKTIRESFRKVEKFKTKLMQNNLIFVQNTVKLFQISLWCCVIILDSTMSWTSLKLAPTLCIYFYADFKEAQARNFLYLFFHTCFLFA